MSRTASPDSIFLATRLNVSSAHSSGKCAPRQSKNFTSVRRSVSYLSPARSVSGSKCARSFAKASSVSDHSETEGLAMTERILLRNSKNLEARQPFHLLSDDEQQAGPRL